MYISKNIPLDVEQIIEEISRRQQAPWNNGRINEYNDFPNLQKLYSIINSGIPAEDFFYQGNLFRLHSSYGGLSDWFDPKWEKIIGKINSDGSCRVLPITRYSSKLVAFSKSYDFTDRNVFYKVHPKEKAILIHSDTRSKYGIDVNAFLHRYGITTRYEKEKEVLFPLEKEFIVKEYSGTPNKFKYYLRKYGQR